MDKEHFNASESNISLGGLLVRKHYCLGMRRRGKRDYGAYFIPKFDGGQAEDGRVYKKSIWDSIYNFLCENEIDVGEYVEYVFDNNKYINSPNVLKSSDWVESFKRYLSREDKPLIWEYEVNSLLTEVMIKSRTFQDLVKAYECVLLDDDLQISPLVRYSYGVENGMEFIVRPLEEAAFKQYYSKRYFYDRHYKQLIPDNLREKAVDLDGNR